MNTKTTTQTKFEQLQDRLKYLKRENGILITIEEVNSKYGKYAITKWVESKNNPREYSYSIQKMYYDSIKELEIAVFAITSYLLL